MLRPRIIPCLLVRDKGLVKTVQFQGDKYVGDPINAVKIFNEKEVDELTIFDIDATVLCREPDYGLIEKLANQSRMPICYGGGVNTVEQALKIFGLGIEKIALSSSAINNPNLISFISARVGSQSVIVVMDVKKKFFIPGNMSDGSYIVRGCKNRSALYGLPHGSGRRLSRKKAREVVLDKSYTNINTNLKLNSPSFKEESPEAYKDLSDVLEITVKEGLGEIIDRIYPLLTIKN